jgi:hypothetical protein
MDIMLQNINSYEANKKTLFFVTGLNINIDDYKPVYEKYMSLMNIFTLSINEDFIDNYNNNINNIVNFIKSLHLEEVYFMTHSFGSLVVYDISIKINEIRKKVVLMEPTSYESVKSIENNSYFKNTTKEFIIQKITENEEKTKFSIKNQKTLLIIQLQIKRLKIYLNGVNKIKEESFPNYNNFAELFCNYHTIKRIHDFKKVYDNNNTHFIVLPLEDDNSKILPHFIYALLPKEIVLYSNLFFNIKKIGGKTRKTRRKYNKNKKTLKNSKKMYKENSKKFN